MAETFDSLMGFAFMVCMILVGTILRARIPILQSALIPASLLGGLIGFVLIGFDLALGYQSEDFVALAFHFFTLSFMSLVLTGREAQATPQSIQTGGLWLSLGWTSSLVLQALVGLTVLLVWNWVTGGELSVYLGMLVTHGFTQGPGQAMAMGSIWQNTFAVENAVSFGLIYASFGFLLSFLVGVPVARYAISRGLNSQTSVRLTSAFLSGMHPKEHRPSAGRQVTQSANVDSLVFHIAILGLAYLITHQMLLFAQELTAGQLIGGVPIEVFFSHNLFFIHGLVVCLILRGVMDRLGLGHYIDDETQKRITGSSVDLMMAATMMSIQLALLTAYLVPILLVCFSVAVVTGALCFFFARYLDTLPIERAITLFGCCTGSTGSGLLLLRILDPDLVTPVARELAYFNVAIILLSLHVLMFMAPVLPSLSLGWVVAIYGTTFLVGAGLMRWLAPRV